MLLTLSPNTTETTSIPILFKSAFMFCCLLVKLKAPKLYEYDTVNTLMEICGFLREVVKMFLGD